MNPDINLDQDDPANGPNRPDRPDLQSPGPRDGLGGFAHPDLAQPALPVLSRRYWLMVALPLVMLAASAVAMGHFVVYAVSANPVLNGLIFAVMAWGSWTMFGHVARVYREDQVFRDGMRWLREGHASGEQHPRLGRPAHVVGMLERLNKLGLGHQVYVHSSAMEPELESLEHFFVKKQELSQYLVGLMVALGLLGTFFGLLETLVQTSSLIGTIAKSTSGGGGADMEKEFGAIVGGLQGPLTAMGTAFSASMFGLVGSIMLGFQMVAVRKTVARFVEQVREEVLSLGERSKVSAKVEITERFLATLLADILQQHQQTTRQLGEAAAQMHALVPGVQHAIQATNELAERVRSQEQTLERTANTVGGVAQVLPVLGDLADTSRRLFVQAEDASGRIERMLGYLPTQEQLLGDVAGALGKVELLADEVQSLGQTASALRDSVREQGAIVRRMDTTLWNAEKNALLHAANQGANSASANRQGLASLVKEDA